MARKDFNDLFTFLTVAREGSFTKAAAQLGVSPSALSQTVSALEARLGVRLLARTTRSVAPTAAGKRLQTTVQPHLEDIEFELASLSELRDKPAGKLRITSTWYAAESVLWPKIQTFLQDYPDISLELSVDYKLPDIVAEMYDAGVRHGDQIAKDMIAVRVGPDWPMAVVARPDYFAKVVQPRTPKDLVDHDCINLRLPSTGGCLPWEFSKGRQKPTVHPNGRLVFNSSPDVLRAVLMGLGLGYLPEGMVAREVQRGELVQVLKDWCPVHSGYHLFYPSHRQASPAFIALVEALRFRP